MADRPKKAEKIRLGVTFTKPHIDGLNCLVREGVYLDRGSAIRDAGRLLLRAYGLDPFRVPEGPPDKGEEESGGRGRAADLDV